MSLKPKKKSEQEKIIQKIKAKERKMDIMNVLPPYTMIVSEGTKTEPYYLNGFVSKINDKYKKITSEKRIEVYGTGRKQKRYRYVCRLVKRECRTVVLALFSGLCS